MALPVDTKKLGTFKGADGEKGRPGTFDSASAVPVPADTADITPVISGAEGEIVNFKIPRGLPGVNAVANDEATATYVGAMDSDTFAALVDFVKRTSGRIPASAFGVQADTGTDQSFALHTAFAAAEAAGGGRTIQLPAGVISLSGTFPLAGCSSGLVGGGSSTKTGMVETGTILRAIAQTGPVLDFNGFLYPTAQRGRVLFADFAVAGDGTAGAGKMGIDLDVGTNSSSIDFRNIIIYDTGDAGLHVKDHYLSEFHGVTVCTPVDAAAQDTPYALLEGANGNRFYGLGIRSVIFDDSADMGASGAIRLVEGSEFQHHQSVFYGTWFENLHVPTGGSLVVTRTNAVTFSDSQFFDCYKAAGATGTSHFRLEAPTTQNYGGNTIRGLIPGRGNGTTEIDTGVRVLQSANNISGVKGSGGTNVILESGVQYTSAQLGGAVVAGNTPAFTDNSGNNTNTLIDAPQGTWVLGERAGAGSLKMGGTFQGDKLHNLGTVVANFAVNLSTGNNIFLVTLGATVSLSGVTGPQVGRRMTIMVRQDATGGRVLGWFPSANIKFAGGASPTLSTGAGKTDSFTFVYDGANWIEVTRTMNI